MAALVNSRTDPGPTEVQLTAGCAYLGRCLRAHRSFAIVTAAAPGAIAVLLDRFVSALKQDLRAPAEPRGESRRHFIRFNQPTDSAEEFLRLLLGHVGFEVDSVALEDLRNLVGVFLRHEASQGRGTVLAMEQAEAFGPRVLEYLQTLVPIKANGTPALTMILAGTPALNQVVDSPGMAAAGLLARERFDLDRALSWVPNARPRGASLREFTADVPPPPAPPDSPPKTLPKSRERRPLRHAVVVATGNGLAVERREIPPHGLTIGRSTTNGLRVGSRLVSRQHAVVMSTTGGLSILDLDSTNGTSVNGSRITQHLLFDGDVVTIGDVQLQFEAVAPGRT